jgi:DMSO/TMAO reductase YedYZ molybdopterin-dependent catalytic subunit
MLTAMIDRRQGFVAGATAAVTALAVGELVPALLGSGPSLVTAVGSEFIDRYAAALKDLAVALFGTNDKTALVVGVVAVSVLIGGVLGLLARRRPAAVSIGFAGFGVIGGLALATDPQGSTGTAVVSAALAVAAGVGVHRLLVSRADGSRNQDADGSSSTADRRAFLVGSGALLLVSVGAATLARSIRASRIVDLARLASGLPAPMRSTPVPDAQPTVPGISPYITPIDDFYRIDTALSTPRVDPASWRLAVTGMVDRPYEITYDELLSLPSVEVPVTIQCVSNEVGGDLVGTAVWQGVPLATILDRAGVHPDATQVVGRSVDDWTAGFPTGVALDGRTAIVAYAMNREVLPFDHGFPARLVVSGLYGYVSATKWLREIELTTWEAFDGYWVPRGWSKEGPIKTASRIDVPRAGDRLVAGTVPIAGVAWSPSIGIAEVEVQVDGGPWERATLGPVAGEDTWVQWHLAWDATPGDHELRVRATDAAGTTQTGEIAEPAPDGATGWHTRRVRVS